MDSNPFALEDKRQQKGAAVSYKAQTYTEEEQNEKLTDYIEIPPEYWHLVRYSTHVRWYSTDGKYHTGGFIVKNPVDFKPKGGETEKRFVKMQNGFNDKAQGYAQWIVAYEDIKTLFAKADGTTMAVVHMLQDTVRGLNENIKKIAEYAKTIDRRLAQLEKK